MESWSPIDVPTVPGRGPELRLYDTATGEVRPTAPGDPARMYVCGITPYDATHLGHAATYLTFDLVNRMWRDAGHRVAYVQNVTDIDDPLLERAERDGADWVVLGMAETALFREDMEALRVLPPDHFVGAVESVPEIVEAVEKLLVDGAAYTLTDGTADVYFDISTDPHFGSESRYDEATMLAYFAERGGDPDRAGKRHRLDPLLWRGAREGEPSWPSSLGAGRPGWHIECAAIALRYLGGGNIDVQGGGSDLRFPHHEMSAAHAEVLTGQWPFARHYVHAGMIGWDGEKMSKSRGNLVFVSRLRGDGVDPAAVRIGLLSEHYRSDRPWSNDLLAASQDRLARWRAAAAEDTAAPAAPVIARIRDRLSDDLDTPAAFAALDRWADDSRTAAATDRDAPALVAQAADALLGIPLR
ncbi:cysteine--1-D-myo-inosityl 2-amino-2-deoxy-alpha-D-glucopyranoside ligase [Fodinicola acaciae]|uniref:cysteine--1-D-myo-inosityl 2-amino-2-deoxy-alpha-D-glucopyranoside ligase n=1 Tax=Fodinicola acaciae TaxID=2681555 RepID=UPI0013D7A02C|nr:cysteine--1-D-myo-inosityl 2-amino-2-deoxy-alpha-D-glucopyranoside ligase [Fodinicola acaciae]